jgi:hypothetical protein
MSKKQPLQHLLDCARREEAQYRWLQASQFYTDAVESAAIQQDHANSGMIIEKVGFCLHRAAMQAETREDFAIKVEEAISAYDTAHRMYEKIANKQKMGRVFRCRALATYLIHWLTPAPTENREVLDECWHLTTEALTAFEASDEYVEYCETYLQLSSTAYQSFLLQWDAQMSEKTLREAAAYGERAINMLLTHNVSPSVRFIRVSVKTAAYLAVLLHYFVRDIDEYERCYRKARSYWETAYRLAADTAVLELLTIPHDFDYLFGFSEILAYYEDAVEYAMATRDRYLIGTVLDMLAYAYFWKCDEADDPSERLRRAQHAIGFSTAAKEQFDAIGVTSPRGGLLWAEAPYLEYNWYLAQYETDQKKKRDLLNEALLDGHRALELAKRSGLSDGLFGVLHATSKVLVSLARIAPRMEKEKHLLQALDYRKECIRLEEQLYSANYWNRGVSLSYLADIKAELSDLEKNTQHKTDLLTEATVNKAQGVHLCLQTVQWHSRVDRPISGFWLGSYQSSKGTLLNRLYQLTGNDELQRQAIRALEDAAETYLKRDLFSRAAECCWKIGRWYDDLNAHLEAAKHFTLASSHYVRAIERVPLLEEFYRTHASYMDAWSEIEQAKYHHQGKRYEQAQHHYAKAAILHTSAGSWSYLGANYSAWACLEAAEHVSRSEQTAEAKTRFQNAAERFLDAKQSIVANMDLIDDANEKELAGNLIRAATIRHQYCLGRKALEEARLLDQQGEHLASSVKYGLAASTFQDVADALEKDSDRQEIKPIIELSKAWQLMTRAEAEVSPSLYAQASQCFERVKAYTTDERAKALAIGHSILCTALDAGMRFEKTRDETTYREAKKYLVTAENYYVKAGFQNASEYTRATRWLLDAYWYIYQAETEWDPTKKTQDYQLSAKLLQMSADSYFRASHHEKTEQVHQLLKRVLEEQTLTMALSQLLHKPRITLSTESFATPSQTYETAVGSERFDRAHIQGKITISGYGTAEEAIEWRLDLVNVGKTRGLLIRIDALIPPHCTVLMTPSPYIVEHGALVLKGRALESGKSESITLSILPHEPGSFMVRPQIIFVDETGTFITSTPEPVTFFVQPQATFEFETPVAKRVFQYLLQAFIDDYMRTRLSGETSGWRTYMEIVKSAQVPKSSVYGARGRSGRGIVELEQRGLVDIRVFPGERGRGGRIRRIRIAYNREPIKRYIDQQIMEK